MWAYCGVEDANRLRKDELLSNELEAFQRVVIKPAHLEFELAVDPFSAANPPDEVSSFSLCSFLLRLLFFEFVSILSSFFFDKFSGSRHDSQQSS